MDGRASHCGPLTVLCYREVHAYRLCLFLLWMLTVFEEIFLRKFFWAFPNTDSQGHQTHIRLDCNYHSLPNLTMPSFSCHFCFRWEVLNLYTWSNIFYRAFYNRPNSQSQISPIWRHAREEGERYVLINKKWSKILASDQRTQKWYLYSSLCKSFGSYPTAVNTFADPQEIQSCILTSYCLLLCIKERQK